MRAEYPGWPVPWKEGATWMKTARKGARGALPPAWREGIPGARKAWRNDPPSPPPPLAGAWDRSSTGADAGVLPGPPRRIFPTPHGGSRLAPCDQRGRGRPHRHRAGVRAAPAFGQFLSLMEVPTPPGILCGAVGTARCADPFLRPFAGLPSPRWACATPRESALDFQGLPEPPDPGY